MNPLHFGSSSRRLFGMYHPAAGGRRPRAAVLCNAWGREYMLAYRSIRQLGNLLAAEGYHVLRFDYYGTGDSGGELDDATIEGYESDIEAAVEEIRDMADVADVALVGLRLGGALAARVAARRPRDVKRLVLWDPVDRGQVYVEELLRTAVPIGHGRRRGPGTTIEELEIRGFPMTVRFLESVRALDLSATVAALPPQTLAAISDSAWPAGWLEDRLGAGNGARRVVRVASPPAWVEDESIGGGAIPVPLLKQVVSWMTL